MLRVVGMWMGDADDGWMGCALPLQQVGSSDAVNSNHVDDGYVKCVATVACVSLMGCGDAAGGGIGCQQCMLDAAVLFVAVNTPILSKCCTCCCWLLVSGLRMSVLPKHHARLAMSSLLESTPPGVAGITVLWRV